MSEATEFVFERVGACRDPKVGNCPEIARNVPGVIAIRDSERPDEVVTMAPEAWEALRTAG